MDPVIQLFVLLGFLLMALTFITHDGRRPHWWWFGGGAVLSFAVALVLHILGMVSP